MRHRQPCFTPASARHPGAAIRCALTGLVLLLAAFSSSGVSVAAEPDLRCLAPGRVAINARIGEEAVRSVILEGGLEIPLQMRDAVSGGLLWTAGADNTVQRFPEMDAGFLGSLTALDIDADGLHDRLYAGDMTGRLWRFDMHHGAIAAQWLTGGVYADFANDDGRLFLAPADVSLSAPGASAPWLNVAIGTAAPGNPSANNRFYVVQDPAIREVRTQRDYDLWTPWTEADLERRAHGRDPSASDGSPLRPGWYVELGTGHVVAPAVTIRDQAVLVIAENLPARGRVCEVFARILRLDLSAQSLAEPDAMAGRALEEPIALSATLGFTAPSGPTTTLQCSIGGQRVAECDLDTRPRKTWWRREDAP